MLLAELTRNILLGLVAQELPWHFLFAEIENRVPVNRRHSLLSYHTGEQAVESKAPNLLAPHPPTPGPLATWLSGLPFLTKDGATPILSPCGPSAGNAHVSHCSEENKADVALRIPELVRVTRFARMNRYLMSKIFLNFHILEIKRFLTLRQE